MSESDRETLESLVTHPGWALFLGHARQEWRDGYPAKLRQARDGAISRETREAAMEAVDYASDQINLLLSWPSDRLAQLTRQEGAEGMHPRAPEVRAPEVRAREVRAPMALALSGQSRRGGL